VNITVYAASSGQVPEVYTQAAARLGEILAERSHILINGAGRTGLMGATIDACIAKGGKAIGIIPQFMIDESWQHKGMTELVVTPNMHERKTMMADRADACIACPGGVGTLDEIFTLLDEITIDATRKHLILYNVEGCWDTLVAMLDQMVETNLVNLSVRNKVHVVESTEALEELCQSL